MSLNHEKPKLFNTVFSLINQLVEWTEFSKLVFTKEFSESIIYSRYLMLEYRILLFKGSRHSSARHASLVALQCTPRISFIN